jgi:hypothetical protein
MLATAGLSSEGGRDMKRTNEIWPVGGIFAFLCLYATPLFAQTSAQPPLVYSLDGISLGASVSDVIKARGEPQTKLGDRYTWMNSAGGILAVSTDANGRVTVIDVVAGEHEVRKVQLPGVEPHSTATLGETAHVNYVQPPEATFDVLCGGYAGEPCESFKLSGGAALIVNFGKDSGLSDWFLSEVVLGNREAILKEH